MSSAYGKIPQPQSTGNMPTLQYTLKNNQKLTVSLLDPNNTAAVNTLNDIFNQIVLEGMTYPQEEPMDHDSFNQYFLSYKCFVATTDKPVGAFYIKPNFPGRCNHVPLINRDLQCRIYC
jgi:hypothetical protein